MEFKNLWFMTDNLSVPIHVDVNFFGARYIDTFIWSLRNEYSTVDEFSWQTCEDMVQLQEFIPLNKCF
jgi:hypothetical protein